MKFTMPSVTVQDKDGLWELTIHPIEGHSFVAAALQPDGSLSTAMRNGKPDTKPANEKPPKKRAAKRAKRRHRNPETGKFRKRPTRLSRETQRALYLDYVALPYTRPGSTRKMVGGVHKLAKKYNVSHATLNRVVAKFRGVPA